VLSSRDRDGGWMMSFRSPALGRRGAPGHWTVAAGRQDRFDDFLAAGLSPGAQLPPSRTVDLDGLPAELTVLPPYRDFRSMYGGHELLAWTSGEATVQVSVHGSRHRRALLLLGRSLRTAELRDVPPSNVGRATRAPARRPR
jgi:hypothetical protein